MLTLELPEGIAERILPILKNEYELLGVQIRKIESILKKRNPEHDPEQHAKNGAAASATLPLLAPTKTEAGRAKKGESEKLIIEFLKSISPKKTAVKEVSGATKTAYGSCVRILRKLKAEGKAKVTKRQWAWATTTSSPIASINPVSNYVEQLRSA